MGVDIRLPNINGKTEAEQLKQIKSYLFQFASQLQWALGEVDKDSVVENELNIRIPSSSAGLSEAEAQSTFNAIKSLIIKSADIVDAYCEEISRRFSGVYVAEATFPGGSAKYVEDTSSNIVENSKYINDLFTNTQSIKSDVEGIDDYLIDVKSHIKTGLLDHDDNGVPVYGIEVGQSTELDGVEVFNKYARFTSDKLSFYDQNGKEVAYISDKKLYILTIEILSKLVMGGFEERVMPNGSKVKKWVGGEG